MSAKISIALLSYTSQPRPTFEFMILDDFSFHVMFPRSVKYDIDCKFPPAPSRAGVGWQIPVLTISLVGNVVLGVVVFLFYRKGKQGELVSTTGD